MYVPLFDIMGDDVKTKDRAFPTSSFLGGKIFAS